MKLVVGLGNPGADYERTRHNAGFRIVERLATRHQIAWRGERGLHARVGTGRVAGVETALIEPQTFMNRSGRAVRAVLEAHPVDPGTDLLVVYDDLDLPFGRLRLRPSGGAGGHNGLGDVVEELGHSGFPRLRFGIGRPPAGEQAIDYVLAPFSPEEETELPERLDAACDAIELACVEGLTRAMNRVNAASLAS